MQVHEALKLVGKQPLSLRLLSQKEDNDLPTRTIVSQTPRPGQKIKAHQALFIVVSQQIKTQIAPTLISKTDTEIEKICHKHEISCTHYTIPNIALDPNCFAQLPRPGKSMNDNVIIAYKGTNKKKPAIFPQLKGYSLDIVKRFLEEHECRINLKAPPDISDNQLVITDHRPMAGSIINNIADITVQLSCRKK